MKKLLLLILFVLNLVLLPAQEVKFVSVNHSIDSLQNINYKSLERHLQQERLNVDTLAVPVRWMLKLQKKLSKKQRSDSNIYIFFCPSSQDSITTYLPLSGKYGYTLFDTTKTSVKELENRKQNLSKWKYQWDLIHDPENLLFAFSQDEEEGAMVIENSTRALARLIKTINCAHNSGKKEVKLYLPFSTITGSVSGLVSELYLAGNPCAEDAEVKATLYEMFGEVVDLSDDYLEDIFSLENVDYDESTKIITLTGSKYKLLITGEKDALCAYNFAKNNLFGSLHTPRTPINFASLEDLQYSSPCELEYLSIDSRKDLLQKIQSETNWYNGSLKDSRQKITINVIATTHEDDKGNLLSFFDTNKELLKNLYDRIDDYRGEFIEEINSIYQNNKSTLNNPAVVALGIKPGVTIENSHWLENFNFLWRKLNLRREHVSAEYISSEQVSVVLKKYDGPSYGLPSLFTEGEELCKGDPFDIIQGIDQQSGKIIDVPLICFLHESEETDREVMYNDVISAGKLGVDGALIYFSVKNLQGASAILKSEVTAQNVARLILGFGDLATLGLGKVCENDNSEFCQAYREYELYINMGLLSANILNEFPQIYKSLKKGLDDPNLSQRQKDGLRKVLGVGEDEIFESARQFVRNNYSQEFLNQITLKYGKENTGALAVLVKRFGDEGANLLRQGKSLDDIASALVKDRVLYRHIGSKAGYLEELKKAGEIPAGYTTYFSADKFDDPVEAISKMQLNSEWTDAVWVAEFEGTQLVGKVQIPNAKWNEANYLEVLTKSFPKWGDGGASQFITKSSIKIKRLRNLETGEVIDFAKVLGKIDGNIVSKVNGDIRKFSEYALSNPTKTGLFVDSWGYGLKDAESLLATYKSQAIQSIKDGKVIFSKTTSFGTEYKIETILNTPSKGQVKIYSGWIIKNDKVDELLLSSPFVDWVK